MARVMWTDGRPALVRYFLLNLRRVWQDLEIELLHKPQAYSNSTSDMFGTRERITALMYSSFFSSRVAVFFRPLREHLPISSFPKMASLARLVASTRRFVTPVPGFSRRTCSTVCNFGGVENGGGVGYEPGVTLELGF